MRIESKKYFLSCRANAGARRQGKLHQRQRSPAMPETARRIVLASRPVGEPKPSDFRLEEFPVPQPGPGQLLLKTKWLSLDPLYARAHERCAVLRKAGRD